MGFAFKLKRNITAANYFDRGDTVIVATSGGPDSTALTHVLHGLQYEIGFHLHIAHYNHNLHGQALKNQKFVEDMADKLNVPCTAQIWKNPAQRRKGSLEDVSREQRFQFLTQLAKKINAHAVVLAHTKDDLAETVLMRILRGTGLQGLRGILPQRELHGVRFIRPMLNISKKEVLAFLKRRKIPYCIDPTNRQKKFFRNKVRLELMPLLKKNYNRNITELLSTLAENITLDYSYLEGQVLKIFSKVAVCSEKAASVRLGRQTLEQQHPAIRHMLVRKAIEKLHGNSNRLTRDHFREIEALLKGRPLGSVVNLPNRITARKDQSSLIFHQSRTNA